MEGDVELGEAAVLRGTVAAVEAAHGETSGLQVPAAAEAHVHRRRQKDAHLRVQVADATATAGDAAAVVPRRRQRDELPVAGGRRYDRHAASPGHGRRSIGAAVGFTAGDDAERWQRRRRPELGPSLVLLSAGQPLAYGHDELLAREFRLDRRLRRESATPRRGLNRSSGSATLAARSIIVIIVGSSSGSGSRGDCSGRIHVEARLRTLLVIGIVRLGVTMTTTTTHSLESQAAVPAANVRSQEYVREPALLRMTKRELEEDTTSRGKKSRGVSKPLAGGCDITFYLCAIVHETRRTYP